MNTLSFTRLGLSAPLLSVLEKRFIAFDTETTGLDSYYDRIIEVGAVLFQNGVPVRQYSSLIHSVNRVPYEARMVNHITDQMVRNAPAPEKVYPELLEFFGDAMTGDTVLVGHNATFDMKFLASQFSRMGISADIVYADTCSLSRVALPKLYSHSQDMVAHAFGIQNRQSHRAVTDAEVCGRIMGRMIPLLRHSEKVLKETERRREKREKYEPCEAEKAVCRVLSGEAAEPLYFKKAGKLVHVYAEKPLFSLCVSGKRPYLVAGRAYLDRLLQEDGVLAGAEIGVCTATEEKLYTDAVRVFSKAETTAAALAVLQQMSGEREAGLTAPERWKLRHELELYWSHD
ncbi:MAG: 3'-5' exonuclease [Clostridia bacterium]|nr:3'-5' exonuclease [Clostridia bacterium]